MAPAHGLQTNYRYNTLNQVTAQSTPDAGLSSFWYDRLGRLIVSQNAKQKAVSATENNRNYSYTKYDVLGRITEVGQLKNVTTTVLTQAIAQDNTAFTNWFTSATGNGVNIEMVTRTVYDNKYASTIGIPGLYPKNLRNRVAYTTYTDGNSTANYNTGTFYSYDIHGNVDTLLQDYGQNITGVRNVMNSNAPSGGSNRWKRMVYKYDLISGKVNHVAYQPNYFSGSAMVISQDAMYHRYSYDAENRLTLTETSTDSTVWQKDARYTYYKHGPLARIVIGQRQVQGLDYAYTLQGWLKGVNSSVLSPTFDMGRDGDATNAPTAKIARDAYGFNLNYYLGDYTAISSSNVFAGIGTVPSPDLRNLYNGNITSMAVNIGKFNSTADAAGDSALLYNYKYDQLNRIVSVDAFRGLNTTTNTWNNSLTKLTQYQERMSYDANGNILKFLRNGDKTATPKMDSLTYKYYANNNRLNWVKDSIPAATYADDIDNNQSLNNYLYDAIGNLVSDSAEGIRFNSGGIKWNVYGKITEINKVDSSATVKNFGRIKKITYTYDAAGNRISKKVEKYTNALVDYTWYVRDASGNTMSTYSYTSTNATDLSANKLMQNEVYLYGSSRLGSLTANRDVELIRQTTDTTYTMPSGITGMLKVPFITGLRQFEISNHLGNVLVTVSDKKIGHDGGGGVIDYYNADVITANDFYSFGMIEPGRKFVQGVKRYRYSINGQEKETELNENITTAEYWMYDSRLGRRWNVDPVTKEYESPYMAFAGNPIWFSDYNGADTTKAKKGVDFSSAKIPKAKYITNTGVKFLDISSNTKEIGANIAANVWNGSVDLAEDVTNLVTSSAGGAAVIDKYSSSLVNSFLQSAALSAKLQSGEITLSELTKKTKDFLSTPTGIEQAGTFIAGIVTPGAFEAMWGKLPGTAKTFFRFVSGAKTQKIIPRGFGNAEQFALAGTELEAALQKSGIVYKSIGIRGSAVTNVSSKGGGFRQTAIGTLKASDIDVFVELQQVSGLKANAAGFIHPDKILKNFLNLKIGQKNGEIF